MLARHICEADTIVKENSDIDDLQINGKPLLVCGHLNH